VGPGTSAGPDLGAASLGRYLFEEGHAIGRRREDMGRHGKTWEEVSVYDVYVCFWFMV
jgi:hypothetical protein